ncbi:MAG: hypothetical protein ABI282_00045 [Candidatus Baltobacteraceae bacterium]
MKRWLCVGLASLALALAWPAGSEAADLSIAAGGYTAGTASQTGGAILLSSAAPIPALPIEIQGTVLLVATPLGGYAVTGEIRGLSGGGFGGAYIGAGAGIGTLSANLNAGPVFTVFAGKPVAPFTTVELRLYKGTQSGGSTAGFLGLRFSL